MEIPDTLEIPILFIRATDRTETDRLVTIYAYRDGNVTPEWDGTYTVAVSIDSTRTLLPTLTAGPFTRASIVPTMYRFAEAYAAMTGQPFAEE